MKFRSVGAEFVYVDGRTDRQLDRHMDRERLRDMTNRIVAIRNFVNALKIVQIWKMLAVFKLSAWLCLLYC
jgi:hypothetical protein